MGFKRPVISQEFAQQYGLTLETLAQYRKRNFLSKAGAFDRIKRQKAYAYKVRNRWFFVTKNGEDLRDIIL